MQPYDLFLKGLKAAPDGDAFVNPDGERFSYRAAHAEVERIAATLQRLSPTNRHFSVYSPNDARAFLAVLAIFRLGGRWIPLNVRNSTESNAAFLQRTDCETLIFHSSLADDALRLSRLAPAIKHLLCLDRAVGTVPSLGELGGGIDPLPAVPEPSSDPGAVNLMIATGGTTGASKAALWSNRTWECFTATFWMHMPARKRPVYLVAAPMTHAAGVIALPLMLAGSTTIILEGVDPAAIPQAIEDHGVTHLFLPPTAIYMLLDQPGIARYDYSSLEYFIYAAAPMSAARLRRAWEVFGPVMAQGYGLAEAPLLCTFLSPQDHRDAIEGGRPERLESSGRTSGLMELRTVDEDGNETGCGELGEIVLKGGLVSPGYYADAEMTNAAKRGGWHRTGDIGRLDEDGFLYIVDRTKDMIISGGFNVYSSEVEQAVMSHPDVANCAVIGVPHPKWGEAVTAIVQLRPGAAVADRDIVDLCKARLGGVKAPKSVIFRRELPTSPAGKVLKRVLREEFWHGQERRI